MKKLVLCLMFLTSVIYSAQMDSHNNVSLTVFQSSMAVQEAINNATLLKLGTTAQRLSVVELQLQTTAQSLTSLTNTLTLQLGTTAGVLTTTGLQLNTTAQRLTTFEGIALTSFSTVSDNFLIKSSGTETTRLYNLSLSSFDTVEAQYVNRNSTGSFTTINGNIGIGTESPKDKLTVIGSIATSGQIFSSNTINITNQGTDFVVNTATFVIKEGRVGIGTMTPAHILDVIKSQNTSAWLQVANPTNGTSALAGLLVGNGTNGFSISYRSANYTDDITLANSGVLRSDSTMTGGLKFATGGAYPIKFLPNDVAAMTILSGGNVGINTTNPTNKLEVLGNIALTGQIFSSGTITTPDVKKTTSPAACLNYRLNATSTTVLNANVYSTIAGTATALSMNWFNISGNVVTCVCTTTHDYLIIFGGCVSGSAATLIQLDIFVDGVNTLSGVSVDITNTVTDVGFHCSTIRQLVVGQTVEIRAMTTDGDDIMIDDAQLNIVPIN